MNKAFNAKKISILNKIRHKPILFDKIFPFIEKRPMIIPYLISNDLFLEEKYKPIIEPASINNKLSKNINDNISIFIFSRLLYEINFEEIKKDIKDKIIKHSNEQNYFLPHALYNFENLPFYLRKCIINYIFEKLTETLKKKINSIINIDIKYSKLIKNFYKSIFYVDFILDYLHIQKEIVLFHLPININNGKDYIEYEKSQDDDDYEYYYLKWKKLIIYGDSYYLDNLNKNINQKVDLICKIDDYKYYENPSLIEYNNIHKLNFILFDAKNDKDNINIFNKINKYLMAIKHKENIEEIYFNNTFFQETKNGNFYEKTYFEEFFYEFGKKAEDQNYKFKSLKRIEFNDDKIKNNIRRAKLRYNLNKVFGFHLWSKINIINYKEIRNLLSNESKDNQNNIMQKFIDDTNTNTNLKILLIDLEYNSPYQKIFYDFCKNFLDNNQNINMIIFHKIGNNNYEENFDKKNISKIIIPNLIDIYYERDINEKNSVNQIYEFNKEFFDLKKLFMVYEGFDDNNNLIYLNISSNSISEEEINRIFLDEQKLCSFILKRENIQIKYNRKKNHLIIKNNKKEKNVENSKPICFFSNIIRGLNNLQKITINGFDFSFYDLINNNISVLSINSLDEFASKNFKHINKDNPKDFENDWKDFNSFEYLQLFQQMKYLIISENVKFLEDILQYIKKNTIKKIKLYTSEIISKNRWNNIQNKIKMKNISLEIVQNNIKNIKYENEEIIDIEEEKYYKIGKNLIYNTNKKFIKNKNWFFSFHSKILQNLGIDYIQRLLDLFSKIYHKVDIQPYHFHLLKRYQISNGKKMDKNEACTIIKPYEKINNLLIIIDPLNKSRKYIGIFKVNYFNNSQGFIICDEGKENFSYEKILNLKISVGEKYIAIYYNNVYSTEKNWEYKCIEVFEIKNS